MIPVYRSTLTRLDLSSVLRFMVENTINGSGAGEHLAKECAQRMHYDYALAFRSPADALRAVSAISHDDDKASRLLVLPVLAPVYLYFAVKRELGVSYMVYDTDDNCVEPQADEIKKIVKEQHKHDVTLLVRYLHFGLHSESVFTHADFFRRTTNILRVDICTYPHTPKIVKDTTNDSSVVTGADVSIVLCENNTLFTGGGGAVVCVRGKTLSKRLKEYKKTTVLLADINASLALAQLKQLDTFIARTQKISDILLQSLRQGRHTALIGSAHTDTVLQTLPLLISSRIKEIIFFSAKQGIESTVAFSDSILAYINRTKSDTNAELQIENKYNNATKIFSRVVCFPLYPSLDNKEVTQLSKVLAALP